jgi:hypothetical protein
LDEAREGTSQVDIGFHYVALDENGNPQDNNASSIPDYAEVPVANPQTLLTCRATALPITLTGTGNDCGPLNFIIVTGPANGSLGNITPINDTSAGVTYSPNSPYCGPDSFTFKVKSNGQESPPATVTLTVGDPNPIAECQDVMTGKNTPITINLNESDTCRDTFTFTVVTGNGPNSGTLTGSGATLTYTPNSSTFEGTDGFDFTVSNCGSVSQPARVTINVVPGPTLTTECRPRSIKLNWTLPPTWQFGFVKDFRIYRCDIASGNCTPSGSPYATVDDSGIINDPTRWTFIDTDMTPGRVYCYRIIFRHQDSCDTSVPPYESPYSNTECSTTCCPPTNGPFWTDYGPTAQELAEWIMAGSGITVVPNSASFGGAALNVPKTRGIFGNGSGADLPIEDGIMLCSGDIALAHGPNNNIGQLPGSLLGTANGDTLGDSDLNGLVSGLQTRDAAVLTFDVTAPANNTPIEFKYVFASEEYHFYIGQINDIMAIWVDGENIAVVPGSSPPEPVAVNNIHNGKPGTPPTPPKNSHLFVDNETSLPGPLNIQYNGLTVLLTTTNKTISTGSSHRVKIAIADVVDQILDSAVFIKASTPCP